MEFLSLRKVEQGKYEDDRGKVFLGSCYFNVFVHQGVTLVSGGLASLLL